MKPTYLGIDLGTSELKVVLVDAALIYEANLADRFAKIIVTCAGRSSRSSG